MRAQWLHADLGLHGDLGPHADLGLSADLLVVIPQDEKAEGLINISNYSLESGQDQKKK